MLDEKTNDPAVGLNRGSLVLDAEGAELGQVAATSEGYFKVEVSMGFDYWLPYDTVARSDGERVFLRIREAELEDRKIDAGAEDLGPTEIEESQSHTDQPAPVERRYDAEADYLLHGRPLL